MRSNLLGALFIKLVGDIRGKKPRHFIADQASRGKSLLTHRKPKSSQNSGGRTSRHSEAQAAY